MLDARSLRADCCLISIDLDLDALVVALVEFVIDAEELLLLLLLLLFG